MSAKLRHQSHLLHTVSLMTYCLLIRLFDVPTTGSQTAVRHSSLTRNLADAVKNSRFVFSFSFFVGSAGFAYDCLFFVKNRVKICRKNWGNAFVALISKGGLQNDTERSLFKSGFFAFQPTELLDL